MPRDGSGNYTLLAGINPVVAGTAIMDTWANPTLNDIATQLNNVVTRDGLLGMTTPFKLLDGTVALPGLTFGAETSSGMYRVGAGVVGLTVLATEVARLSAGQFSTVLGTAAAPSRSFTGDLNTGIYSPGADQIGLSTAGVLRLSINATGNITIAAPTAGVGLTQTGFAGSDTVLFNGGTSGSFRVTDRGLPYGTSIHNNAGSVTGSTTQYIASGTYTPVISATTNVAASNASAGHWTRVGNIVFVSGNIQIDPTAGSTLTQLSLTLPINSASNASPYGTATRDPNTTALAGCIRPAGSISTAQFAVFNDIVVTNANWYYTFAYEIQ